MDVVGHKNEGKDSECLPLPILGQKLQELLVIHVVSEYRPSVVSPANNVVEATPDFYSRSSAHTNQIKPWKLALTEQAAELQLCNPDTLYQSERSDLLVGILLTASFSGLGL